MKITLKLTPKQVAAMLSALAEAQDWIDIDCVTARAKADARYYGKLFAAISKQVNKQAKTKG